LCDVSPNEVDQSESRWTGEVDGKELDIRCTHIATVAGDKLCVRLMGQNHVPADLDSIVVDEDDRHLLRSFLSRRQGMLIVVGPTGSGKSTLLFGLASEVDRPDSSVVTLEDPVERRCPTMTQIEVDANGDDMSFADGVKLSLRLDPDSLVVGETRGFDSARAAVAASNSGRSLMTSMHGDCHATAIDNLRSWGIKDREIATTVRCVVAARLIRQLCDECKATRPAHPSDQQWLQNQGVSETSELTYPVGCDRCMQTGYFGRMPLHRVWQLNPKQSQMIRTGHDAREIVPDETSFQAPAIAAVMSGDTSVETIRAAGLGI
jgi:type II secretory ATPase GspE/PulE/Tfp pilus assembly ATPase PilB-like protein